MKKAILFLSLFSSLFFFGQEQKTTSLLKNEIKANALFLVIGATEFTYERILSNDSGVGISVFYAKQDDADLNFSLSPYYRAYFGEKPAAGFFVEGFSMLNSGKKSVYVDYVYNNNTQTYSSTNRGGESFTDLALGFSVGAKWIHPRGFVFEFSGGIGRNLIDSNSPEVVGRGGISLGYRF
ncbi:DUF3575 domain-containing protein [Flavobacterium ovatum]|uniref:DUF3575 domain-containing protein n=1 Tax=Flavobacterium ovatum TaxID=1928857 RepID=UPI00344F75B8